jgi:hypothetical protein
VPVTEDYEYSGVGGRISQVTTTVGVGATEDNTRPVFDYDLVYDPLGNVSSRTYPRCTIGGKSNRVPAAWKRGPVVVSWTPLTP